MSNAKERLRSKIIANGYKSDQAREREDATTWAERMVANLETAVKNPVLRPRLAFIVRQLLSTDLRDFLSGAISSVASQLETSKTARLYHRSLPGGFEVWGAGAPTPDSRKELADFLLDVIGDDVVDLFHSLQDAAAP